MYNDLPAPEVKDMLPKNPYVKRSIFDAPAPLELGELPDMRAPMSEVGKSMAAFVDETKSLVHNAGALGAELLRSKTPFGDVFGDGLTEFRDEQLEAGAADAAHATEGRQAPKVAKIEDIKGVGDFGNWLAYQVPKGAANVALLATPAGLGRGVAALGVNAGVKGILKSEVGDVVEGAVVTKGAQELAKKALAKRLNAGTIAGGLVGGSTFEAGNTYGEAAREAGPEAGAMPAFVGGGVAGALEFMPLYAAAKSIGMGTYAKTGIRKAFLEDKQLGKAVVELARRATLAGGVGAGIEGVTEGLQELVGIASVRWAKKDPLFAELTDEDWSQVWNSVAAGAAVGGTLGSAGGVFAGPKPQQNATRSGQELVPDTAIEGELVDEPQDPRGPINVPPGGFGAQPPVGLLEGPKPALEGPAPIPEDSAPIPSEPPTGGTPTQGELFPFTLDEQLQQQPKGPPQQRRDIRSVQGQMNLQDELDLQPVPEQTEMDLIFGEYDKTTRGTDYVSKKAAEKAAERRGIENFEVVERPAAEGSRFIIRDLGPEIQPVAQEYVGPTPFDEEPQQFVLLRPDERGNLVLDRQVSPETEARRKAEAAGQGSFAFDESYGQRGGKAPFKNIGSARSAAQRAGLTDAEIVQVGDGYVIKALPGQWAKTPRNYAGQQSSGVIEPTDTILQAAKKIGKRAGGFAPNVFDELGISRGNNRLTRGESMRLGTLKNEGGVTLEDLAETLSQYGYDVLDEGGNYSPNRVAELLSDELIGKKGGSYSKNVPHDKVAELLGLDEPQWESPSDFYEDQSERGMEARRRLTELLGAERADEFIVDRATYHNPEWNMDQPIPFETILDMEEAGVESDPGIPFDSFDNLYSRAGEAVGQSEAQMRADLRAKLGGSLYNRLDELGLFRFEKGRANGAQGAFRKAQGTTHLYGENMSPDTPATGVFLHEGSHAGLNRLLNGGLVGFVSDIIKLAQANNPTAAEAYARALDQAQKQVDSLGLQGDAREATKAYITAEETAAYYIEFAVRDNAVGGVTRRMLTAMKGNFARSPVGRALKRMGLGFELTPAMAVDYARAAVRETAETVALLRKYNKQLANMPGSVSTTASPGAVGSALYSMGPGGEVLEEKQSGLRLVGHSWVTSVPEQDIYVRDGIDPARAKTLGDVLDSDKLFEAQPWAKDIKVGFADLGERQAARIGDTIYINSKITNENMGVVKPALLRALDREMEDRSGWRGFDRQESIDFPALYSMRQWLRAGEFNGNPAEMEALREIERVVGEGVAGVVDSYLVQEMRVRSMAPEDPEYGKELSRLDKLKALTDGKVSPRLSKALGLMGFGEVANAERVEAALPLTEGNLLAHMTASEKYIRGQFELYSVAKDGFTQEEVGKVVEKYLNTYSEFDLAMRLVTADASQKTGRTITNLNEAEKFADPRLVKRAKASQGEVRSAEGEFTKVVKLDGGAPLDIIAADMQKYDLPLEEVNRRKRYFGKTFLTGVVNKEDLAGRMAAAGIPRYEWDGAGRKTIIVEGVPVLLELSWRDGVLDMSFGALDERLVFDGYTSLLGFNNPHAAMRMIGKGLLGLAKRRLTSLPKDTIVTFSGSTERRNYVYWRGLRKLGAKFEANTYGTEIKEFPAGAELYSINENFRRWFAGSKVVDAEGNPLLVYHTTTVPLEDITVFTNAKGRSPMSFAGDRGFYFSPTKDDPTTRVFGNNKVGVYLNIKNPAPVGIVTSLSEYGPVVRVPVKLTSREINVAKFAQGGYVLFPAGADPFTSKDMDTNDGLPLLNPKQIPKGADTYKLINPEQLYNDTVALLQSRGFDGVIVGDSIEATIPKQLVVFEPNQIKSATGNIGAFDPNNPNILYSMNWTSPIANAINSLQAKGTGAQYKAMLQKSSGVKKEEGEDMGLWDWLDEKGKVTRDEIEEFVRKGGVRVEEVVKGGPQVAVTLEMITVAERAQNWDEVYRLTRLYEDQELGSDANGSGNETKYASYQTPGGKSYRELLITIPAREEEEDVGPAGGANTNNSRSRAGSRNYASSHWPEPNIVVHLRFNERQLDGKKTLFVEEVQSDWHQEGRKKGYDKDTSAIDEQIATLNKLEAEYRALADAYENAKKENNKAQNIDVSFDEDPIGWKQNRNRKAEAAAMEGAALQKLQSFIDDHDLRGALSPEEMIQQQKTFIKRSGIPDAPFKSSWPLLGMKRAITWAAQNGFEQVAWAGGQIQNERYPNENRAESGMTGFYDKILPSTMKKFLGKRSEVRQTYIDGKPVWAFDVTDPIVEQAMSGMPLYSIADTVGLTQERVEQLIRRYGYPMDGKKSKARVAWVDPADFVRATVTGAARERIIYDEAGAIDKDRLARETQTPFLDLDGDKIVGHEGRHRMAALAHAGITKAPVVLSERAGREYPTTKTLLLKGQDFENMGTGASVTVSDVVPLAWDYEGKINARHTGLDFLYSFAGKKGTDKEFRRSLAQAMRAGPDKIGSLLQKELNINAGQEAARFAFELLRKPPRGKIEPPNTMTAGVHADLVDSLYSFGDRWDKFRRRMWTDANKIEEMNELGAFQRAYLNYVDSFRTIEKKHKGVYDVNDLAKTKTSTQVDEINRRFADPLTKLVANTKLAVEEINDWLAARHILLDDVNRKMSERAAYQFTVDLLPHLSQADKKALQATRKHLLDGKDAAGNAISKDEVRKQMAALVDFYVQREIPSPDPKIGNRLRQRTFFEWKHFKEHASGMYRPTLDRFGNVDPNGIQNSAQMPDAFEIYNKYKNRADVQEIGKLFDELTRHHLRLLREGELITDRELTAMIADKAHYAPLRRAAYAYETAFDFIKGRNIGPSKGVKTRYGSPDLAGMKPVHVIQNALAKAHGAAASAQRNLANNYLYEQIMANPNEWANWFEHPLRDPKKNKMDNLGFVRATTDTSLTPEDILLMRKGRRVILKPVMSNQRAAAFAAAANQLSADKVGALGKVFGFVNSIVRFTAISASPAFLATNIIRDPLTAVYNMQASDAARHTKEIYKNYGASFRALRRVYMQGIRDPNDPDVKMVEAWEKAGGRISFVQSLREMETGWKDFKTAVMVERTSGIKQLMRLFHKIEDANIAIENVMRLATFTVLAKDPAVGEAKAARIAKDLTTNFSRKGFKSSGLGMLYLFFNATVQGNVQAVRNMIGSKKLQAAVAGTIGFAMLLDMIGRATADEDDDGDNEWDKIPLYEKERNIILPFKVGGEYIKIPAPWVYNVMWRLGGMLGENIAGVRTLGDTAGDFFALIATTFNPLGGKTFAQIITPTALDPVVQSIENKDFAGNTLRPFNYPGAGHKPNAELAWESTPDEYKALARKLNEWSGGDVAHSGWLDVAPADYQNLVNFFGGGLVRFLAQTATTIRDVPRGEAEVKNVPILRQFAARPGNQMITEKYYDLTARVMSAEKTLKEYRAGPARDPEKYAQAIEEYADELRMVNHVKDVERQIKSLRTRMRAAQGRGDEERVEDLRAKIASVQARFNQTFERRVGS